MRSSTGFHQAQGQNQILVPACPILAELVAKQAATARRLEIQDNINKARSEEVRIAQENLDALLLEKSLQEESALTPASTASKARNNKRHKAKAKKAG